MNSRLKKREGLPWERQLVAGGRLCAGALGRPRARAGGQDLKDTPLEFRDGGAESGTRWIWTGPCPDSSQELTFEESGVDSGLLGN